MQDAVDPISPAAVDKSSADSVGVTASYHAAAGPYSDLVPHARGGLGEVFSATDTSLHRIVAIKRLQERRVSDAESRKRFLVEAEVTARLEHPGVVPVYTLFSDERGGPAYAMRFVQGPTLWDAIKDYHAGSPDPVAFRRLLQCFLQVCQTVAYAHSRGVIHRDLKPQNVMIGKFGETLVVDWGLAKVVGRPEESRVAAVAEGTLVPGSGSGDETAMGSAVGTPAYMSPEQAAGRWNVIDHRSDVYGLGALLYSVLTCRPPLEKGDWPEMQQKIQRGAIPRPREVKADVPPALEAVCLKAMALEPSARYPSAEALDADVEHWLADEPVSAYREPLAARARRWMRRHRTLVGAAAVLLVAGVVGLSVGTVLLNRARLETDKQRRTAESSQQKAEIAQKKAETLNRFLIEDLLKQADPVNNPVGDKITVRQLLDKAAERLDAGAGLESLPEVEAELRAVIGHAYEYLWVLAACERHYRRAWELCSRLHGPDHPETLALLNRLIWAVTLQERLADAEPMARDAVRRCRRSLGEDHPETAEAEHNLAEVCLQQRKFEEAIALRRRAAKIMNSARGPNDNKTLEIESDLAVALIKADQAAEGVDLLRRVVDRRRKFFPNHPELPVAVSNLSAGLMALGRFAAAEPLLRETVEFAKKSGGDDGVPALAVRSLLYYALEGQEQWKEAEKGYLEVLAARRLGQQQLNAQLPVRRSLACLGRLYSKQQRWDEAARYLSELILSVHPDPKRDPAALRTALAAALAGTNSPPVAEPLLRECREAIQSPILWAGDWLTFELASRHGDCLRRLDKLNDAESLLVTSARDLSTKAVGVPSWSVPAARKRVADLYRDWNKLDEAAKWK